MRMVRVMSFIEGRSFHYRVILQREQLPHRAGVVCAVAREASMLTVFFTQRPPRNLVEAEGSDTERFGRFFRAMLTRGILIPPSQFEAWFISAAHEPADIARTVEAAAEAFRVVA